MHTVSSYINFYQVLSEFLTWRLLIFWQRLSMKIKSRLFYILSLNPCICIIGAKNFHFLVRLLLTNKLSLDLIFIDNFCQNIKSFFKQNSVLRIHSKPSEFTQNWTEIDKNFQCAVHNSFLLPTSTASNDDLEMDTI